MKRATIIGTEKPRGRPVTGVGVQIGMRWHQGAISAIDDWRRQQEDIPSRAEAIRRLVEIGLKRAPKR